MSKIILLVDDDPAFRGAVRDILEVAGYTVIESGDGKEALPIVKHEHVDLVITDILMPEIEGNRLAIEIKALRPDLKVIGMTGGGRIGSPEQVEDLCVRGLFETVLHKPFLEEDLITPVVAALA